MGSIITAGHILACFSWALAAAWLWKGITAYRGMPSLPDLSRTNLDALPPIPPQEAPDLTVIVPARDEEASIETCLRSLIASAGLRLQIIPVDDRSTDRTGELMECIAREAAGTSSPHRFEVLHITSLPAKWLGKPHAMAVAAERAAAPWILFTDGDVVFQPGALMLALREAAALQADHLVLLPTVILKSTGERAVLSAMQALATWAVRLWKIPDPRAEDYFGAGGFNLIRWDVFQQIGGFEALRMEVIEDVHLGRLVKRAGFAQRVVIGPDLVSVRWLQGAFGVVQLLEKNGFAVTRFRTLLHLLACVAFAIDAIVPLLAMARGGWTAAAGIATYIGIALVYRSSRRTSGISTWHALLFAPAVLVITYGFVRSMILALLRGGIVWRGTLYPLADLRRAARDS